MILYVNVNKNNKQFNLYVKIFINLQKYIIIIYLHNLKLIHTYIHQKNQLYQLYKFLYYFIIKLIKNLLYNVMN